MKLLRDIQAELQQFLSEKTMDVLIPPDEMEERLAFYLKRLRSRKEIVETLPPRIMPKANQSG